MLLIETVLPIAKFDLFMNITESKNVYFWTFKMADMEKIHLFMHEKCSFPSHNEYLEFDGRGKWAYCISEKSNICEWAA